MERVKSAIKIDSWNFHGILAVYNWEICTHTGEVLDLQTYKYYKEEFLTDKIITIKDGFFEVEEV